MILELLYRTKTAMRDFTLRHAHGPHAAFWLFALAFAESSFFPIPPDVILVAILLAGADRFLYYSTLTTVGSVLGGIAGYGIGYLLFDALGAPLIAWYGLEEEMAEVGKLFAANAFLAIFTAAFTPIPYKVFTIAAGLFKLDLGTFILASLIGRGMRFYAEGILLYFFGARLGALAYKYFNLFTGVVALAVIILGLVLLY